MGVDEKDGEGRVEENGDDHYLEGTSLAQLPLTTSHPQLEPGRREKRRCFLSLSTAFAPAWAHIWVKVGIEMIIAMIIHLIPSNR